MNTKLLMTLSALAMGVAGVILSFLPHEISGYLHLTDGTIADALILQILGALYFGFAMLNWTARANLIGGIYSRPVAIGNLAHFTIGALALLKGYTSSLELIVLIMALVYTVFAIAFGMVFFTHPVKDKN
jgi:hypothetical protein